MLNGKAFIYIPFFFQPFTYLLVLTICTYITNTHTFKPMLTHNCDPSSIRLPRLPTLLLESLFVALDCEELALTGCDAFRIGDSASALAGKGSFLTGTGSTFVGVTDGVTAGVASGVDVVERLGAADLAMWASYTLVLRPSKRSSTNGFVSKM